MRISDWSSDVCSSDLRVQRHEVLGAGGDVGDVGIPVVVDVGEPIAVGARPVPLHLTSVAVRRRRGRLGRWRDRKSVVSGKSVSVRVDLGGRRIIKKKKKNRQRNGEIKITEKKN